MRHAPIDERIATYRGAFGLTVALLATLLLTLFGACTATPINLPGTDGGSTSRADAPAANVPDLGAGGFPDAGVAFDASSHRSDSGAADGASPPPTDGLGDGARDGGSVGEGGVGDGGVGEGGAGDGGRADGVVGEGGVGDAGRGDGAAAGDMFGAADATGTNGG